MSTQAVTSDSIIETLRQAGFPADWAPADTEPFTRWTFAIVSEWETSRGVAWDATMTRDDGLVADVYNNGDGGANHYGDNSDALYVDAALAYPGSSPDMFITVADLLSQQ